MSDSDEHQMTGQCPKCGYMRTDRAAYSAMRPATGGTLVLAVVAMWIIMRVPRISNPEPIWQPWLDIGFGIVAFMLTALFFTMSVAIYLSNRNKCSRASDLPITTGGPEEHGSDESQE